MVRSRSATRFAQTVDTTNVRHLTRVWCNCGSGLCELESCREKGEKDGENRNKTSTAERVPITQIAPFQITHQQHRRPCFGQLSLSLSLSSLMQIMQGPRLNAERDVGSITSESETLPEEKGRSLTTHVTRNHA